MGLQELRRIPIVHHAATWVLCGNATRYSGEYLSSAQIIFLE
jgi:hypothetical protein